MNSAVLNNTLIIKTVESIYHSEECLDNQSLYRKVAKKLGVDLSDFLAPVGKSQTKRNLMTRKIRWAQQTLKIKGLLEQKSRGVWESLKTNKKDEFLHATIDGKMIIALSTDLGMSICADSRTVFASGVIDEPIHLTLTSSPYPIQKARSYGGESDMHTWIDMMIKTLEPIVERLAKGGSIVINLSNDVFLKGLPARSLYLEYFTIACWEKLGLYLMERAVWSSNKYPSPTHWACVKRYHVKSSYEPILWFCNDPLACPADNRRILEEHTESHRQFVANGGMKYEYQHGDGAYRKRIGEFNKLNGGRIPNNSFYIPNYCLSGREVNRYAKTLGLPVHSAKMPEALASRFVRHLTEEGQVVLDHYSGTGTTPEACELTSRRWYAIERVWEYVRQSFRRFDIHNIDYWVNPAFLAAQKEF